MSPFSNYTLGQGCRRFVVAHLPKDSKEGRRSPAFLLLRIRPAPALFTSMFGQRDFHLRYFTNALYELQLPRIRKSQHKRNLGA